MDPTTQPDPASTSYGPTEPPEIVLMERMDFAGGNIGMVLYGISIILAFRSLKGLLKPRFGRAKNPALAAYVVTLFGLSTVFVSMNMRTTELSYIDNRFFPGGPLAYAFAINSTWRGVIPNACFILSNWFADGLLLYRAKVIFDANIFILALPTLIFMASLAFGIITLYQAAQPGSSLFNEGTIDFALAYFSIAVTLNVLLTLIISGHLWRHQRRIQALTGRSSSPLPYANIMTMLVESCAIYAMTSLIFIGTYASENAAATLFLPILHQSQVIAPLLIISRVAYNKGFSTNVSVSLQSNSRSATSGNTVLPMSPVSGMSNSMSVEKIPQFATMSSGMTDAV